MLSLTRRVGERVRIIAGDKIIWVSIQDVGRGKAKIGFQADRDVDIRREELLTREATP
jgi:carbon storage regulator CsrA